MTDQMLIINLRKGDLNAFHKIFSKYKNKVFFFSLSYLKSMDKAEDIVQDVFIKVWENRHSLKVHNSFNNFLFKITKNTILNQIRKTNYEVVYRKNYIQLSSAFEYQGNSTLDSVIYNDLKSYINWEIEKLPPGMRKIYKLSRIQLLSNEEITNTQKLSVRRLKIKSIMQFRN